MLNQSPSAKFFRFALGCAAFAYVLVLFGAYTRLSDANLGCPAWPGCYGKPFAPLTAREIYEARRDQPLPVDAAQQQVWRDTLYRYLPDIFGLFMFRLVYLGWQLKQRYRTQQVLIPGAVAILAFLQSGLGMISAGQHLRPLVVMMDLVLALAILGLLWWVMLREQRFWKPVPLHPRIRHLRVRALIALLLVAGVILLGGWTAANDAGLACPDFPTCQGSWWPVMDFVDGFTLGRNVGSNFQGGMLDLSGITAIDVAHRVAALITLLYVGWLALRTMRVGYDSNLCRYGMLVLVLLLGETVIGVMDIVLRMPLLVAVAHIGIGVLLMLSLVTLSHVLRPRQPGAGYQRKPATGGTGTVHRV